MLQMIPHIWPPGPRVTIIDDPLTINYLLTINDPLYSLLKSLVRAMYNAIDDSTDNLFFHYVVIGPIL